MQTRARTVQLLLVEDDQDHAFLMREALVGARIRVGIHHVDDGIKCLAFLRKEPPYLDASDIDLVLLDLHMPRMDGAQTLEAIVEDDRLKHLPVVVLTTSKNPEEVRRMYKLRCSSFITKPVDFDSFSKLIIELTDYWFDIVALPKDIAPTSDIPPSPPKV